MTPDEAITELRAVAKQNRGFGYDDVRRVLDACVATAEAKETLRCERVARMQANEAARQYRNVMFAESTHVPTGKHLCDMIADEILRTSPHQMECPACDGCNEECGRCGGTGKILRTGRLEIEP